MLRVIHKCEENYNNAVKTRNSMNDRSLAVYTALEVTIDVTGSQNDPGVGTPSDGLLSLAGEDRTTSWPASATDDVPL